MMVDGRWRRDLEPWLSKRCGFGGGQVMFSNRKEKKELLEGLVIGDEDAKIPSLPQVLAIMGVFNF